MKKLAKTDSLRFSQNFHIIFQKKFTKKFLLNELVIITKSKRKMSADHPSVKKLQNFNIFLSDKRDFLKNLPRKRENNVFNVITDNFHEK